jgi:hypothetical protein
MATSISRKMIDSIISLVREPPLNINRDHLIRSIQKAENWYRDAKSFSHNKPMKEQNIRLNVVFKTAKRLEQLLSFDEVRNTIQYYTDPELAELLQDKLSELQTAIEMALWLPYGPDDRKEYCEGLKLRSPFEWLAGYCLPDVYEIHFRRPARTTVNGEYVLFTAKVLDVLGVDNGGTRYTRSAIVRALTSVRSNRPRRALPKPKDGDSPSLSHQFIWREALLGCYGSNRPNLNWNSDVPLWTLLDQIETAETSYKPESCSFESYCQ